MSTLSPARIRALRKGYSATDLAQGGIESFAAQWPPSRGWAEAQVGLYFALPSGNVPVMKAKERERVVIALLALTEPRAANLAIHVYWALMEGLTVDELYAAVGLAALYGGVQRFNDGANTVTTSLGVLAGLPGDQLDMGSALAALRAAFPS